MSAAGNGWRDTPAMQFDAYDPAFVADPYPTYARLREAGPFFDDHWRVTFFASHADVTAMLRDKRFGRDIRHVLAPDQVDHRSYPVHLTNWYRFIRGSFIDLEPPEHTRIRGAVKQPFARSRAEARRGEIERLADRLLDSVLDRGRMEVIADFATPIPIAVVAHLMGIPDADHHLLLDWSHAIVRVFDINVTPAEERAAETAVTEFADYVRAIVHERRRNPGEDLISELAAADDPLSDDDLVATCILVLNAGHEATVHGIGNGVLALARNPDQFALLRNGSPADAATEELLRYDTPLQMFERWVLEDLDWAGVRLAAGDKVGLLYGSANHDPAVFEGPEALAIERAPNPHVSFGLGTHFCLGAPLARVELEVAFARLADRFRSLRLVAEPSRQPSLVFRGVTTLEVEFDPA
jgi:cytochrome P450